MQQNVRQRDTLAPIDRMLTAGETKERLGIGLSTLWRDVKAGRVPLPYYVNGTSPRWKESEIDHHIANAPRHPGRAA